MNFDPNETFLEIKPAKFFALNAQVVRLFHVEDVPFGQFYVKVGMIDALTPVKIGEIYWEFIFPQKFLRTFFFIKSDL